MIKLASKYGTFAAIATILNIVTQYISLQIYGGKFGIYIALAFGTIVGLIVKYTLDKKYIFYCKVESLKEDTWKFFLYSTMGVFTTLIFWFTELLFNYLWHVSFAKYVGAVVGLTMGYVIKYKLDKRFVFITIKEKVLG